MAVQNIGKGTGRIRTHPDKQPDVVVFDSGLNRLGDVTVNHVLPDDPGHSQRWRDHMIDKALLRELSLDPTDRGLADGADLELRAVDPDKRACAQTAFPVEAIFAEYCLVEGRIISGPKKAGDGSLHGVSDIVDIKLIPVGPAMKVGNRAGIGPQVAAFQAFAGTWLGGQSKGVLHRQEACRGHEQTAPSHSRFLWRAGLLTDRAPWCRF